MRTLIGVLSVVVLVGCANQPPEYSRGTANQVEGVIVKNNYVPMRRVRQQAWGDYKFVPGYARQGVIVTPSRTWTYGQGPGFRGQDGSDIQAMSRGNANWRAERTPSRGSGRQPVTQPGSIMDCPGVRGLTRNTRIQLGRKWSPLTADERMAKPLHAVEKRMVKTAVSSGCMTQAIATREVKAMRAAYVRLARSIQMNEKGGAISPDQGTDLPDYEAVPPESASTDRQDDGQAGAEATAGYGDTAPNDVQDQSDDKAEMPEPKQDASDQASAVDAEDADKSGKDGMARPDDPASGSNKGGSDADSENEPIEQPMSVGEFEQQSMGLSGSSKSQSETDADVGLNKPLPEMRVESYQRDH